jgi:hypothetical protein
MRFLLLLALVTNAFGTGLASYPHLLVADSSGAAGNGVRVDLAILGMALPDSRARLAAALARLQPRYFLPSHQDDFFRPLSAGFQFGPLTDFSRVQRECAQQNRSRLILLDYFRPWTLPRQ